MAKIIDIATRASQRNKQRENGAPPGDNENLPDVDNSVFWLDPSDDEPDELLMELPAERIAAIVVKGCFGLYHLVREHRRRHTAVPTYLLRLARDHEDPLIPAAEALYIEYFEGGGWAGNIPDKLLDVGSATTDYVDDCTRHAMRLHRLLEAIARVGCDAQRRFFEGFPTDQGALLLAQVLLAHCQLWRAREAG